MKKILINLSLFTLAVMLVGCNTYSHTRQNADGSIEKTFFSSFVEFGQAGKITSKVEDGAYKRSIGVDALSLKPDTEFIQAVAEGTANGVTKALKP